MVLEARCQRMGLWWLLYKVFIIHLFFENSFPWPYMMPVQVMQVMSGRQIILATSVTDFFSTHKFHWNSVWNKASNINTLVELLIHHMLWGSLYFTGFIQRHSVSQLWKMPKDCRKRLLRPLRTFPYCLASSPVLSLKLHFWLLCLSLTFCNVRSATWEQWNHISSGENHPWTGFEALLGETIIMCFYVDINAHG